MKNSLSKQVKDLLSERTLNDAQLEKIADILQEKLTLLDHNYIDHSYTSLQHHSHTCYWAITSNGCGNDAAAMHSCGLCSYGLVTGVGTMLQQCIVVAYVGMG